MTNRAFFRSCEVVMFHIKLTTSLIGNNNLIKSLPCYRGCHISNNITSISEELQRCYKLLKLLIYKVCKPTSEKVFSCCLRARVQLVIDPQDYTKQPAARRVQPV